MNLVKLLSSYFRVGIYYYYLSFFFLPSAFANSQKDSLLSILNKATSPIEKARLLISYSEKTKYFSLDSCRQMVILAKELSKINQDTALIIKSHLRLALLHYNYYRNYLSAKNELDTVKIYYYHKLSPKQKCFLLSMMGDAIYYNDEEFVKSIELYFQALEFVANDSAMLGRIYYDIGWVYADIHLYDKAIEYSLKGLKVREAINKDVEQSLTGLSYIYRIAKQYDKSLAYIERCKNELNMVSSYYYYLKAELYYSKLKVDSAYFFSIKGYESACKEKNTTNQRYNLSFATVYGIELGKLDEVMFYIKRYEKLNLDNLTEHMNTPMFLALGNKYLLNRQWDSAKVYLDKTLKIQTKYQSGNLGATYKSLADWYQHQNKMEKANLYYQKYIIYSDSLKVQDSIKAAKAINDQVRMYEMQNIVSQKDVEIAKRELSLQNEKYQKYGVFIGLFFSLSIAVIIFRNLQNKKKLNSDLVTKNRIIEIEQKNSEKLLLNILPKETADELKTTGKAVPKYFDLTTVMFTDFRGFTQISEKMKANELVNELDFIFKNFDRIISEDGSSSRGHIEKIKTIGDSYMCAGGLPIENKTNPLDIVLAALEIKKFMVEYKNIRILEGKPYFEVRIGIHSGPVVAGVVGDKKFAYDIWGDTVNTASRMESSGEAGKVNISGETYRILKSFSDDSHPSPLGRGTEGEVATELRFAYRGKIPAKNKGEVEMYFVE